MTTFLRTSSLLIISTLFCLLFWSPLSLCQNPIGIQSIPCMNGGPAACAVSCLSVNTVLFDTCVDGVDICGSYLFTSPTMPDVSTMVTALNSTHFKWSLWGNTTTCSGGFDVFLDTIHPYGCLAVACNPTGSVSLKVDPYVGGTGGSTCSDFVFVVVVVVVVGGGGGGGGGSGGGGSCCCCFCCFC